MNANERKSHIGGAALGAAVLLALLMWAPAASAQDPRQHIADPSKLDEEDAAWNRESAAESAVPPPLPPSATDSAMPPSPPTGTIQPPRENQVQEITLPAASLQDEEADNELHGERCDRDDFPVEVPGPDPSSIGEDDDFDVPVIGGLEILTPSSLSEDDDCMPPVEDAEQPAPEAVPDETIKP